MGEVGTNRTRERLLLSPAVLMCLIEKRFDIGVSLEHPLVEPPCDGLRIGGHGRGNLLDDLNRTFAEHLVFPSDSWLLRGDGAHKLNYSLQGID